MRILNLQTGTPFSMGDVDSWRVVGPEIGARRLTLNHSVSKRGAEFPQHTHDEAEDVFVALEGTVEVRQGDRYSLLREGEAAFIPGGEVHGTVTTSHRAVLISFQSPPDLKLYSGDRDSSRSGVVAPTPSPGHESAVQIVDIRRASPVFRWPGVWRCVTSARKGARHLGVDSVWLLGGEMLDMDPRASEEIWVVLRGRVAVECAGETHELAVRDVVLLSPGDACSFRHVGADRTELIRCRALVLSE